MNLRIAALAAFIAMTVGAKAADLETGLSAYGQGDHGAAMAELRPLAEEGNAEAQHVLGLMHLHGLGVAKDGYRASIWLLKAAEQGHAHAQLRLAQIYDNGLGVPPHDADAVAWYRKAAEQGQAEAQLRMGQLYGVPRDFSRDVPQDDAERVAWFHKAAEQGNVDAQWYMGDAYERGSGVDMDIVQAFAWYNLAIAFGDEESKDRTADLRV